jgi:cytochrome c peroxidase
MGHPIDLLIGRLRADSSYTRAFAAAFPEDPSITAQNIAKAIATFERSLVSPATRFDRWVEGEEKVLTAEEIAGFGLFAGKAGCARCHSGWAFTDSAFHDIGLPGEDRGRGAVLGLDAAMHAFKTPGLREVTRSAPYMHDGSLETLESVVRHYENGIVERPSLSPDLPRNLLLSEAERRSLVAFLGTLIADDPTPAAIVPETITKPAPAMRVKTVTQSEKNFFPARVMLKRNDRLWIVNNDTRTHNVRIFDPALEFDSGAQEPGEAVEIAFPMSGSFVIFCGIHPTMEIAVDVEP